MASRLRSALGYVAVLLLAPPALLLALCAAVADWVTWRVTGRVPW